LKSELKALVEIERPELIKTVAWAAANGDRSENADYLYGKKRLREIERRIRFLMKRLEAAEVVDPRDQDQERVFFGATVTYSDASGKEHTVSIVGTDEVDPARGRVSWVSPVARALLKSREGDVVTLKTPAGEERLEVLEIRYRELG
jgi:transcription elongation factor GreB